MQARCPHCHEVFSTGEPGVQTCPRCSRQVNVPDPRSDRRPALDPYAAQVADASLESLREPTPWERRSELGGGRAFIETFKASTFAPSKFWPSVRPEGPLLDALLWGWIIVALGALIQLPFALADAGGFLEQLDEVLGEFARRGMEAQAESLRRFRTVVARFGVTNYMLVLVGSRALFFPLFALVVASFVHLGLLLFGGARGGFPGTFRAFCYASGPLLLSGVPILGFFAYLGFLLLFAFGLRAVHSASSARILLALIAPVFLLCCCISCGVGLAFQPPEAGGQPAAPAKPIELRSPSLDFTP